jgi:hypothetical protein
LVNLAFTPATGSRGAGLGRSRTGSQGVFLLRIPILKTGEKQLSPTEVEAARQRRLEAMALQEIEGNPLDAEDIAIFEMFEREGWSHEKCREYLLMHARNDAAKPAR